MSGILNNKTRLIDTIVTSEGQKQLATGEMRISFVSFTDSDAYYQASVTSGSEDPSDRLYFEASNLPQDSITFESDDFGKLKPFKGSSLNVVGGKVLSGTDDSFLNVVTGTAFTSVAEDLLKSSINNFELLQVINTEDVFFDKEDEFSTSVNTVNFRITDGVPFAAGQLNNASIDEVESIFQDKKLSNVVNFKYLPPINKPDSLDPVGAPLGEYPILGQGRNELTYKEIEDEISKKENAVVEFSRTTISNNIIAQFFEKKEDELAKLDIIDFGEVITDDIDFPVKHIFFAGKVFMDGRKTQTFVNLFTLIFE